MTSLNILTVNLDNGTHVAEQLPAAVARDYLGGRGLAVWLLHNRLPAGTAALARQSLLIFSGGPLAGTGLTNTGGLVISCRSPLTGGIAHSWAEGNFGAALRRAGYAALVVTGQSAAWCIIRLEGREVAVELAEGALGTTTNEATKQLRARYGADAAVAAIGPAGEAGVAYASIVCDGLVSAEPAGTGVVMAHKRVKAVVVRGGAPIPLVAPERAQKTLAAIEARLTASPLAAELRLFGSNALLPTAHERGALSGRNGQDTNLESPPTLTRATLAQRGRRANFGCEGCQLSCEAHYVRRDGGHTAYPTLEAVAGFGFGCGITRPDALIMITDLCLRLGLDVVSTAAALAFLMECQEQGLARQQTLPWGDDAAMIAAVERLGKKTEKRDVLSLGVGEMQEIFYGSQRFVPQARRLALPALDLRALPTAALAAAVTSIGGDLRGAMVYEDLVPSPPDWIPGAAGIDLAARVVWHERFAAALDAAGLCRRLALQAYAATPGDLAELVGALGYGLTGTDLARLGERIVTLERLFTRSHANDPQDRLPERWQPAGLAEQLQDYYRRHGWDENGDPPAKRLADLGISA